MQTLSVVRRRWRMLLSQCLGIGLLAMSISTVAIAAEGKIDFNRDIRPILSNHCFACHGPDSEHREAGLRLDDATAALAVLESGDHAIVPGKLSESTLASRITSGDEADLMPPPEFNKPLSTQQRDLLTRWIEQGAPFSKHWSLITPTKIEVPEKWKDHEIDYFIDRMARDNGITPNDQADRRFLIRRVTLDITGLPPTIDEINDFLADKSPGAYSRLIDRLMKSPRFGEHQSRYWLDLVRYGDTHGLHLDNYREMWPYRDWVIGAINDNMSFKEFIRHQLAGDLIEGATLDQQVASGFNRLNVTTSEGGSIYDEVYVRNCVDRVSAFGTVFLGMTTGCAVCHDHKFDPISMQDFYSLFAYFNSLDGRALDGNKKDHPPTVRVPTEEHNQQLAELAESLAMLEDEMDGDLASVDEAQSRWEQRVSGASPIEWNVLDLDKFSTTGKELKIAERDDGSVEVSGKTPSTDVITLEGIVPEGRDWQLLRIEALTDDPKQAAGISENGNAVLTELTAEISSPLTGGRFLPVKLVYGEADYEQLNGKFAVGYAIDGKFEKNAGWAIGSMEKTGSRNAWFVASSYLTDGKDTRLRIKLHFKSMWAGHQFRRMRVSLSDGIPQPAKEQQLVLGDWDQVGPFPVEYANAGYYRPFAGEGKPFNKEATFSNRDQKIGWTRVQYPDAAVHDLPFAGEEPSVTVLHRTITAASPQKATILLGTQDGYILYLNQKKVAQWEGSREIKPLRDEHEVDLKKGVNHVFLKVVRHEKVSRFAFAVRSPSAPVPESIAQIAKQPADKRDLAQQAALRSYYRRVASIDPDWLLLRSQRDGILDQMEAVRSSVPTTLVWKELTEPRPSHILTRGEYDQKGDVVPRAVPTSLPAMPPGAPNDRMGLAQWLTEPSHPLTARVAVNRFWQQLFGVGIVKTSEDFGAQGEPPSHPELLDWLAVDFQENGWDVKRLLKQMMMSGAYRRSHHVSADQLRIDPENRLLARGPRYRLDAETLRDQALFASGLLVEKIGGPSVKPPQPKGLWSAVGYTNSDTANFRADSGEKIYRRSVYTFWKRTSSPPTMAMFDAPSRESCTARRERTNTPLQALVMLNEIQFVECARNLAFRTLSEAKIDQKRIARCFTSLTAREPSESESAELMNLLSMAKLTFQEDPDAAKRLIGIGASKTQWSDPSELAAWTILASTMLNLDEVVTK